MGGGGEYGYFLEPHNSKIVNGLKKTVMNESPPDKHQ